MKVASKVRRDSLNKARLFAILALMLPTSTPTILSKDDEVQIVWQREGLRIGITAGAIHRAMGLPHSKASQRRREEYVDENMGRIISIAEDRLLSSRDGYVCLSEGEL